MAASSTAVPVFEIRRRPPVVTSQAYASSFPSWSAMTTPREGLRRARQTPCTLPARNRSRQSIVASHLLGFGLFLGQPIVDERRDRHDPITLGGLHDRHAARPATVAVDATHLGPQDRAELGDEHQLLLLLADQPDRCDVAGVLVERVGDDAAGGAVLDGEVGDIGPLAETLLGDDQQLLAEMLDDLH